MKKILLIGQGSLGHYIKKQAVMNDFEIFGTYYKNTSPDSSCLNICDIDSVEKVVKKINPDFAINCAARGDIDFLETHPKEAFDVNSIGAKNVAQICNENKTRLIHISTDSVFDGIRGNYDESDKPNPQNAYAQSKFDGEKNVAQICNDYIIIRTNFYGLYPTRKYFLNWIFENIKQGKGFTGFSDVIFSPLDASTLSKMIVESLEIQYSGILHLSQNFPISKYDFIKNILDYFKLKNPLRKGSIDDQKPGVKRPKNTSLNNAKSKFFIKTKIPGYMEWVKENQSSLNRYLNN